MNSELQYVVGSRKGAPLFYAGWAGFALFGTVAALGDHADLAYAAVHALVAVAMCTWYAMTAGKAAPVVGAALGTLFGVEMAFFLYSDLTSSETAMQTTAGDTLGLLAAALILSGAFLGLRGGRHASA